MAQEPKTPQQQMLEAVKEYVTQELLRFKQETMAAVNALGKRIDEFDTVSNSPDPVAQATWRREAALRSAVDLYRDGSGTFRGERGDVLAAAKSFEAFLNGAVEGE